MARYQAFTPNLPEATCLMADLVLLSLPLKGSSPPSPVLLFPPILNEKQCKSEKVHNLPQIAQSSNFINVLKSRATGLHRQGKLQL